jgi:PilZ domain-containing protein
VIPPTVMTAKRTKRGNRKRRGAPRYRLALPVLVRTGPQRRAETIAGKTHDISSQGVYFAFGQELAPGSRLDFTLALPAEITQGTKILIRARGRVVRAEKKKKNGAEYKGIAAKIEKYDFIRAKPTQS